MELKDYLDILRRRWYLVAIVPVIVLVGVVYQAARFSPSYTATAQIAVTSRPEQATTPDYRYDNYYAYLTSEYILDDLVEVVRGNVFAADVAKTIADTHGVQVSPGQVQGAMGSSRVNRILTLTATASDPQRAVMIVQGAAATLQAKGASYFGPDSPGRSAMFEMIQQAEGAGANTQRQNLILVLQVLVALFAGVLLAFLVDYLDDTLRSPEHVTATLGLPVIGTIPNGRERA